MSPKLKLDRPYIVISFKYILLGFHFLSINILLISLFYSLLLYLDLSEIIRLSFDYSFIIFLIFSVITLFIIKYLKQIKSYKFKIAIRSSDFVLAILLLISYVYYSLQFFSSKFISVLRLGTDSIIHRLITYELTLNENNGFQLVHRNVNSGGIDYTDIFYPLGFHSIAFFMSKLFNIPTDIAIYYLFLLFWLLITPISLCLFVYKMTQDSKIAVIFSILFLNVSEILFQYFILGLWPFLIGYTLTFYLLGVFHPFNKKNIALLVLLFLALSNIYPSFAFIFAFTLLILNFNLSSESFSRVFTPRNNILILLFLITTAIFVYVSRLYVNFLIVLNSVFITESLGALDKLIDLKKYFNNLEMRFFDLNSSRWLVSLLVVLSLLTLIFRPKIVKIMRQQLVLFLIFSLSLIFSLISGIIGIVNYVINPIGSLFYYDFNRIYSIYLVFALLLISSTIRHIIPLSKQLNLMIIIYIPLLLLQVSSTFTTRLNEEEFFFINSLQTSNTRYFSFNINDFSQTVKLLSGDPTFLNYTFFGIKPEYFNDSIRIISR